MDDERIEYLSFAIEPETCAIPLRRVREVVGYLPVTALPSTPASLRGVVNLRGTVLPVVDLGAKFGFPPSPPSRFTCIVVVDLEVDGERTPMGIVTDAVHDIVSFARGDIHPPPSFGTPIKLEYLQGLANVDGRFALVLELDRVLDLDELLAGASTLEERAI